MTIDFKQLRSLAVQEKSTCCELVVTKTNRYAIGLHVYARHVEGGEVVVESRFSQRVLPFPPDNTVNRFILRFDGALTATPTVHQVRYQVIF